MAKRSRQEKLPLSLNKQLEALLGPRTAWPLPLLREIADQLLSGMGTRVRSVNHEINWLKICGFCLRPGFGFPNDEIRIKQLTEWIDRGPQFRKERNEVEWWIFCRRVAAGLLHKPKKLSSNLWKCDWWKGIVNKVFKIAKREKTNIYFSQRSQRIVVVTWQPRIRDTRKEEDLWQKVA